MSSLILLLLSTAILGAGLLTDLRTRKIPNRLILVSAGVALAVSLSLDGWNGLVVSLGGMAAGLIVCLPLVLLGALGSGDMKLLMAFGLTSNWSTVMEVALLSVFWAAGIGLVLVAISGQLRTLLINTAGIFASKYRAPAASLHRIPFATALMAAWITHLLLMKMGVSL